jgi:hypothetical protein
MSQSYDFMAPLSRMYRANRATVTAFNSVRRFDGGVLVAAEAASAGAGMLSKILTALSQHKREERKLRSQLRGVGHAIESDIVGKIDYGVNMLARLREFYQFLEHSGKHPQGDFIFELADRIRDILELDDSFEFVKSASAWDSQKDFLFKHGKESVVRRVAAFYNMIRPKIAQIDQEKNNVFNHFSAFLEDLAHGIDAKAAEPSEHALYRARKTLESLEKLTALYVDVILLSVSCLTG